MHCGLSSSHRVTLRPRADEGLVQSETSQGSSRQGGKAARRARAPTAATVLPSSSATKDLAAYYKSDSATNADGNVLEDVFNDQVSIASTLTVDVRKKVGLLLVRVVGGQYWGGGWDRRRSRSRSWRHFRGGGGSGSVGRENGRGGRSRLGVGGSRLLGHQQRRE